MHFHELEIPGAYRVEPERIEDDRGFFARTFCRQDFAAHGLEAAVAQCNVSWNRRRGTVRGMHFAVAPAAECKLVRCTRGAVHDVLLDLRPGSPAFRRHASARLDAMNRHALYVPTGVAHGFQTLEDDTELLYQMSTAYDPACARGVRWSDPAFTIAWPLEISAISERDLAFADFAP